MKHHSQLKQLLLLFVALFISNCAFSQKMYANVNVGYGIGMGKSFLLSEGDESSYGLVFSSLGKGLNMGGAFGYMFSEHFGAELGVSYLMGEKTKAKVDDPDFITTQEVSSKMLRFIPTIIITGGGEKIKPYAKFGIILGTGSILSYQTYREKNINDKSSSTLKDYGGIAFGIQGGAGATYKLSDKVSLFGEINTINMSYFAKKGKLIESTANGKDILPDLSISEKEVEYVETMSNTFVPDMNKPKQQISFPKPFGSLGLNVGVRFGF